MPEMFLVEGTWHDTKPPQSGYISDDTDFRSSSPDFGLRVVRTHKFLMNGEIKQERDGTVLMFYSKRKATNLMVDCDQYRKDQHPNKDASFRVVKKTVPTELVKLNMNKGYNFSWENT